jgi:hypothetical protein
LFGLLYAVYAVSITQHANRIWKHHYTVLVRRDRINAEDYARIDKEFTTVHYYNTKVSYFDYRELTEIPLEEVSTRFDPLDPRVDKYMRNVDNYFFSPDGVYSIIYIRTRTDPVSLVFELRDIFGPLKSGWFVADIHIVRHVVLAGSFILLVLLCAVLSPKNRLLNLIHGLPWLPILFFGNFSVFAAAVLLYFAFSRSTDDLDNLIIERLNYGATRLTRLFLRHILFRFIICFAAVSMLSFVSNFSKQTTFAVMLAVAAGAAVTGILAGRTLLRFSTQAHRLFFHIPLGTKRGIRVQKRAVLFAAVLLPAVLAAPLLLVRLEGEVPAGVPAPVREGIEREIEYGGIKKTGIAREGGIPSIPDFIAHRFYQEGYLYGPEYTVPDRNEKVFLSTYAQNKEEKIVSHQKTAFETGNRWLKSTLEAGRKEGIITLLLDQEAVFKVSYQNISYMPFKNGEIIIYLLAWFLVQVPGLFYRAYLTPVRLYDMKSVELKRRCKAV